MSTRENESPCFPACDLILTERAQSFETPLPKDARFLWLLGLEQRRRAYEADDAPCLRFALPEPRLIDDATAVVAGRRKDVIRELVPNADADTEGLPSDMWPAYERLTRGTAFRRGSYYFACVRLAELARLRNVNWQRFVSKEPGEIKRHLDSAGEVVRQVSEAKLIASDLRALCSGLTEYGVGAADFAWLPNSRDTLLHALRGRTVVVMNQLDEAADWLKYASEAAVSVIVTRANLVLQRRILWLAFAATLVALLGVFLSTCDP